MSTAYSEIFKKANVLFSDAKLLSRLTDDEYTEYLEIFLSKSKSVYFKNCKKDLTDVDNVLKQFNQNISDEEQWILAQGIKLVWVQNKLYREEKLRDKIGTKDYTLHSPANLLDKLILLSEKTERNLENMVNSYSFNEFEGFN